MKTLQVLQVVVAILLIVSILMQSKGSGLGGVFGGGGDVFSVKRGAEKMLFQATIVFSALFFGIAMASILLQ